MKLGRTFTRDLTIDETSDTNVLVAIRILHEACDGDGQTLLVLSASVN